ncbi:hypothetical protein LWI29_030364 [Acer saccharum]|uniref:Peptidase S54 rhomboid domain-containing protein n=1 Tax=Acer saccharum TaxID=4024 RepID=A0AA39VRS7_ACESA|nr:hypothetical protein LWI29_030364 [Acer saccharum]
MDKNIGNVGKTVGNSSVRRYDRVFNKASSGSKNGMKAKPVSLGKVTNMSKVSGSRFNILSEDADVMITEDEMQAKSKGSGSINNKGFSGNDLGRRLCSFLWICVCLQVPLPPSPPTQIGGRWGMWPEEKEGGGELVTAKKVVVRARAQFSKRIFQSFPNYASHRRGWKSWFQRLSVDDCVLGLIIANTAVFILWRIADQKFMMNNFTISLDNFVHGRLHTLITSAFSHVDMEHILSNMIGLYFFGMSIGKTFGPEYLLKLYLAGAIGGSVFYLVHHAFLTLSSKNQGTWTMDPSRAPALGASGAVNAIMLLNILLNPKATLYLDFIIPVPAALLGIFLIGKDMLRIIEGNSNISGSAHLGGAAVAAIAWARHRRGRF